LVFFASFLAVFTGLAIVWSFQMQAIWCRCGMQLELRRSTPLPLFERGCVDLMGLTPACPVFPQQLRRSSFVAHREMVEIGVPNISHFAAA